MIDYKFTDIWVEKFSLFYKGASQSMYRERVDCFIFIAHFVFMYLDKANYAWKKTIALQVTTKICCLTLPVSLGGKYTTYLEGVQANLRLLPGRFSPTFCQISRK